MVQSILYEYRENSAMACREFSLWYNPALMSSPSEKAMACREFSLWYNRSTTIEEAVWLWLVGNSRYGTINSECAAGGPSLWLVGNSRYGTMQVGPLPVERALWLVGNSRYGTICDLKGGDNHQLWLVGNSRYGTIRVFSPLFPPRYGL